MATNTVIDAFLDDVQAPKKVLPLNAKQRKANEFAQALIDNVGKTAKVTLGRGDDGKVVSARSFKVGLYHAAVDRLGVAKEDFQSFEDPKVPGVVFAIVRKFDAKEAAARIAARGDTESSDEEAEAAIAEAEATTSGKRS